MKFSILSPDSLIIARSVFFCQLSCTCFRHNIIQAVFDWQNYHLHQLEAKKEGEKDKQIVMDDDPETLEYLAFDRYDILQERFAALKIFFPENGEVFYEYDFGDSWGYHEYKRIMAD